MGCSVVLPASFLATCSRCKALQKDTWWDPFTAQVS